MRFLPLVFKNVFRKKTRTLLTVGSIVLPLLVICVMGTFLKALEAPDPRTSRGSFRLVARHRVSLISTVPRAFEDRIRQLPGVEAVSDFSFFFGKYRDGAARNNFVRAAVDPETILSVFDDAEIVAGSAGDWRRDRTGCLVGSNLVAKYGWKVGDRVVIVGDVFPTTLELTIRGVYYLPNGTSATLFFDRRILDERFPAFAGSATTIWIKAKDAAASERLGPEVDALFENTDAPTKTESEKDFQNGFISMLGNVQLMLTGICGAIVFVILLIAANTMAMAARERVSEIAVLRTLGYPKGTILAMILGESLLLALIGGFLGIGLFVLGFPGFRTALLNTPMAGFASGMKLFPSVLAAGFGVAVFVGLVAGIVPAVRSAQRSITDGLRQVG